MKKLLLFALIVISLFATSCRSSKKFVPRAVNTINSVELKELNLERKDYQVLNTLTAEATIECDYDDDEVTIREIEGEFEVEIENPNVLTEREITIHKGIIRLGYLANDYESLRIVYEPEFLVRNLAIYRLINMAKTIDADGVIEPIVSTSVEESGRNRYIYKTTVQAKAIKLTTNK